MRDVLEILLEAFFRLFFTYDCSGTEKLPSTGPVIIAANHPSYLDPILLSLEMERPIRFMAWDGLFRVPFLGALMQAFGAFPVDVRTGQGHEAFEKAKDLILSGEVVGIFPEGKRSRTGWMEPHLRAGAARLAWETGALLIPATITGAFRAWPHYRSFPRPAHVQVRFHDPIDLKPYRDLSEPEAVPALLAELRRRVERSLLPGVKADLRIGVLYRHPAPWPRSHESLPPLALALLVFWKTRSLLEVLPAYVYIVYLLLDRFVLPQRRVVKWARNISPVIFFLAYAPKVLQALSLPPIPAGQALAAVTLGALLPYLYERGRTALTFIRGLVFTAYLDLGVLYLAPQALGPHVALPLFAAAFAWERRTVFWRYSAPILAAYALWSWRFMGGGFEVVPHVIAGLLGWLLTRLLPYSPPGAPREEPVQGLGLHP